MGKYTRNIATMAAGAGLVVLVASRQEIDEAGGLQPWLLAPGGAIEAGASWLRKRIQKMRNPKATIVFEDPVYAGPGFTIDAPRGGSFIARAGTEFRRGFRAELDGAGAKIEIGAQTVFTSDVVLQCGAAITIGSRCQLDYGALLADGSYRFRRLDEEDAEPSEPRSLTLGDRVTVTTKCTVIADIGSHTMVGANSVVTDPLPGHVLAAGAPAKVIGYFGPDA